MSDKRTSEKNLIFELNNLVPCEKIGITIHIGICVLSVSFFDIERKVKLGKISRYNNELEKMQSILGGFSKETERLLNGMLKSSLNSVIDDFFENTHYSSDDVYELVLCCPTAVEHILLGELFMTANTFKAEALSLCVNKTAELYLVPFISSEIGGDMTAEILAVPQGKSTMILSLETQAKIAHIGEKTVCCLTPSCAFFDGADYESGMTATKGAIDSIWRGEAGEICYSVINDVQSEGISPSGVMDALEIMLDEGIVDGDGTMTDRDLFYIGEDYYISQQAVRAAQAAKAKLFSALKGLMNELDVWENDIDNVFICGSYAKKLREKLLYDLKFIPVFPKAKLAFTQNAAEIGMSKILFGEVSHDEASAITGKTEVIHEFDDEFFDAAYMASILF